MNNSVGKALTETKVNRVYLHSLEHDSELLACIDAMGILTGEQWVAVYEMLEGQRGDAIEGEEY